MLAETIENILEESQKIEDQTENDFQVDYVDTNVFSVESLRKLSFDKAAPLTFRQRLNNINPVLAVGMLLTSVCLLACSCLFYQSY